MVVMETFIWTASVLAFVVYGNVICNNATDWHFTGPNIGLHKQAIQKPGTYSEFGYSYEASLAVDGNDDSDFAHKSCSLTTGTLIGVPYQHIAQWVVDLGGDFNVTGIIIVNRKDKKIRLKDFVVFGLSSQTGYWRQIHNDTNVNTYTRDRIYIRDDNNEPYSKIAVNLPKHHGSPDNGWSYLTLCEVMIYAGLDTCRHLRITNGYMYPNQTFYGRNTKATITCDEGFHPRRQDITCMNSGQWNSYDNCEQIHCDYPGKPENGYYIKGGVPNGNVFAPSSSLPFKRYITGKCDIGYESKNNAVRQCQSDKTWSGQSPDCKRKQCPYPEYFTNGAYYLKNGSLYNSGSAFYNTTIYIICNANYIVYGSKELMCRSDKTWGKTSGCKRVTCAFPELPIHGVYATTYRGTFLPYSDGPSHYLDIIHILCPTRYFLNASSETRQCLETGSWSGEAGKCVYAACKRLEELDGGCYNYTDKPRSDEFPYDTIATAFCYEGFQLLDNEHKSRRCTRTGVWDKNQVVCKPIPVSDKSESGKNVFVIGCASSGAVLILVATTAVTIILCRRKRRQQRNERETNLYSDLSCVRSTSVNEYSNTYELQLSNGSNSTERSSGHEAKVCSATGKEGPFYCNMVLDDRVKPCS